MSSGDDLVGQPFGDLTLTGIVWKDDGIALDVELPDSGLVGSTAARFVCRWLHSLQIALDLGRNPGPPLTWEGGVKRRVEGGFLLSLQFGSGGTVTLACDDLELRVRA